VKHKLPKLTNLPKLSKLHKTESFKSSRFSRANLVTFAIIFASIGGYLIFRSFASGFSASIEPENGALAGCAVAGSDASASGGKFLKFSNCSGQITTTSSVTQDGITWMFDSPKQVGQFANGEYWVLGPVTITNITPGFNTTTKANGWQINPPLVGNAIPADESIGGQSFDGDGEAYHPEMMPSFPYTATAGQSIVKAVSLPKPNSECGPTTRSCLSTAAVLTVLGSIPTNNGATVFRPPYMGTNKTLFSTVPVDTAMTQLPRLTSTTQMDFDLPTMANALNTIQRVNIGVHVSSVSEFYPEVNVNMVRPYAPGIANDYADSILRALIVKPGDSETLRRQIVIAAIQRGIDTWGARAMGMQWYADGGTVYGMRLPTVFAAQMLNNQTIKDTINGSAQNDFAETGSVQLNTNTGKQPVWGQDRGDESQYWLHVAADPANDNSTTRDPYGYIDGAGLPGNTYQICCNTPTLKADSLIVHLIPGMVATWNNQPTLDYVERYVTQGLRTQPDPCAPLNQGGGPNPSRPGECILDPDLAAGSTFTNFSCQAGKNCGRFPTLNATHVNDTSGWTSALVDKAWPVYRSRW
jgi:hypothetical protein